MKIDAYWDFIEATPICYNPAPTTAPSLGNLSYHGETLVTYLLTLLLLLHTT
jgi:hypothetical protein